MHLLLIQSQALLGMLVLTLGSGLEFFRRESGFRSLHLNVVKLEINTVLKLLLHSQTALLSVLILHIQSFHSIIFYIKEL